MNYTNTNSNKYADNVSKPEKEVSKEKTKTKESQN